MLPIFFLVFFLVQTQAVEFPDLLKSIDVTWDDKTLTSQLNSRQTMSIANEVPFFIFCEPFKTSGKDGNCRMTYRYSYRPSTNSTFSGSGVMSTPALLISTINETYSCMKYHNVFTDFVNLYQKAESSLLDFYTVDYECEITDSVERMPTNWIRIIYYVVAILITLIIALCAAYIFGYNKGEKVSSEIESSGVIESSSAGGYYKKVHWEKELTF